MTSQKKMGEFFLNLNRPEGHLAADNDDDGGYEKLVLEFWDLIARFWDLGISNRDRNGNSWNPVLPTALHCIGRWRTGLKSHGHTVLPCSAVGSTHTKSIPCQPHRDKTILACVRSPA
jgi:hypothetical protein